MSQLHKDRWRLVLLLAVLAAGCTVSAEDLSAIGYDGGPGEREDSGRDRGGRDCGLGTDSVACAELENSRFSVNIWFRGQA